MVLVALVAIFGYSEGYDRVEHNTVNVHVEHVKNTMVIVTGSTCFVVKLTSEELHQAKNDFGRERLIVTIIREVIGRAPEYKVYHNDRGLTSDMNTWCGDRDIFFLMREAKTSTAAATTNQFFSSISRASSLPTTGRPTLTTTGRPTLLTTGRPKLPITSTIGGLATPIESTTTTPIIMYDKTLSMKAVIVTSSGCFVYRMSEIDKNLLNLGAVGKDLFEKALLSKDRSVLGLADLTGSLNYMKTEIQDACSDKVYLLP